MLIGVVRRSQVMFIETICSDVIVEKNIRAVKLSSPDVSR